MRDLGDATPNVEAFVGDYASEGYADRANRADWVGISIQKIGPRDAYIRVRSRGDLKRPTCTFDGTAFLADANTLVASVNDGNILFFLTSDSLVIEPENEADGGLLNYFCSGGGSLAGTYTKLDQPLDTSQIADDEFSKELALQGVSFDISATTYRPFYTAVVIQPEGLEIDNSLVVHEVEGAPVVSGAEIEDLNSDGWPEILVYLRDEANNNRASLIGYSVNNGKSMSQVYLPELTAGSEYGKGYVGQDQFAVIETSLARRFRVYDGEGPNAVRTNTVRQIQYKLVDGEASRRFEIVDVAEIQVQVD